MNIPPGQRIPDSDPEVQARCGNPGTELQSSSSDFTPAPLCVNTKGISFLIAGHRQNGR